MLSGILQYMAESFHLMLNTCDTPSTFRKMLRNVHNGKKRLFEMKTVQRILIFFHYG